MRQSRTTLKKSDHQLLSQIRRAVPMEGGELRINDTDLLPLSPLPTSWIMLKTGDFLVSKSGTIRMLLRKTWELGFAECLRLRCEAAAGQITASLDVEKMELNSSNFENLHIVVRDAALASIQKVDINPAHLGKTMRYNILTLLGFGKIGSDLHVVIPGLGSKASNAVVSIGLQVESQTGQLLALCMDNDKSKKRSGTSRRSFLEIELHWVRDEKHRIFRIAGFNYPSGTSPLVLECLTLASEISNRVSAVSSIIGSNNI